MKREETLTIGQLAKQVGVRTSALRYYEQEGLLRPRGRTESGYRYYTPDAVETIQFIQRAQRLGFSLTDIATLLKGWQWERISDEKVIAITEARYLALEKQITDLLIVQHEMEQFIHDLWEEAGKQHGRAAAVLFHHFIDRICANPSPHPEPTTILDWFKRYTDCVLSGEEGQAILNRLRGQHVHIWQEEDAYHILIISHDPAIGSTLQELAALEAGCQVHEAPQLSEAQEGYLFIAAGPNAFFFARLFLALEQA